MGTPSVTSATASTTNGTTTLDANHSAALAACSSATLVVGGVHARDLHAVSLVTPLHRSDVDIV
jgi:hypothetical protein